MSRKGRIIPYDDASMRRGGGISGLGGRSQVPEGVPISVCVKVDGNEGHMTDRDIKVKGTKVEVKSMTSEWDYVFDVNSDVHDLFDRSIAPLVKACCEGIPATVLFFGSHGSNKTVFAEQTLPLIVQNMMDTISKVQNQSGSKYSFEVKFRAYEVYDEGIQDLQNVDNRDLPISYDAQNGNFIGDCTVRGPFMAAEEIIDHLMDTFGARTSVLSDFGPASHFTTTVWELMLTQSNLKSKSSNGRSSVLSKFTVVECASTNHLLDDRNEIRSRFGSSLSKSIFLLDTVASSFVSREQTYAPFSESKVTQLLEESFVGNSITVCVAHLKQGEPSATEASIALGSKLRKGVTYPCLNDERLQGLVRWYRSLISQLRDEISAIKLDPSIVKGDNQFDIDELNVKIKELEGRIVRDNLEKLKMKEDKERIYAKLVEFRTKYNELVEQKSQIQASNIQGEEEKLKIAKALLDLRIENNALVEKAEAEKYELVTKVLALENEILQYEMKEEKRSKESVLLSQKLESAQSHEDEYKQDLVALKDSYVKMKNELQEEMTKNEELGAELLTLVNQKSCLESENDELQTKNEELINKYGALEKLYDGLRGDQATLSEQHEDEIAQIEAFKAEKIRLQLELQRMEVDFETKRLEYLKEGEDHSNMVKTSLDDEIKNLRNQRDALEKEMSRVRPQMKQNGRRIKDLEVLSTEQTAELEALKTENRELLIKIGDLTDQYRTRLTDMMHSRNEPEEAGAENPQDELLNTFKSREADLEERLKHSADQNTALVGKNRELFAKLSKLRDGVEDQDLDENFVDQLQENIDGLHVNASQREVDLQNQVEKLQAENKKYSKELSDVKEKHFKASESVHNSSKESDAKIKELEDEVQMLRKQVDISKGGLSSARMREMQAPLLSKIEELQGQLGGAPAGGGGGGASSSEVEALKQEVARLKKLNSMQSKGGGGGAAGNYAEVLTRCTVAEEELEQYKKYMQKTMVENQQQIKKLKADRDEWKRKAGG